MSTKDLGNAFEQKVAVHYEALGYRVERNVLVEGHQIDLLAQRYVPGMDMVTLMIEAKFRSSGIVGINEATPFINVATHLISKGKITGAVMVANGAFSDRAASLAAPVQNVKLMTMAALEQELFNPAESLIRLCADYGHNDIANEYVPLAGLVGLAERLSVADAARYIDEWAHDNTSFMMLVGDFGSGKSTVLNRVQYEYAKRRIETNAGRYPVLLELRSLLSHPDLWSFIQTSLRDRQYLLPSKSVFEAQLSSGALLLLLDGFDEIHTGATAQERARYFKRLEPLISSPSPCIISTRPTYFDSFNQMSRELTALLIKPAKFDRLEHANLDLDAVLEGLDIRRVESVPRQGLLDVLQLSPLSDDTIRAYLAQFRGEFIQIIGQDDHYVRRFLYNTYDLRDLLTRPLLLKMAVATILKGGLRIAEDATLGPSTLYDLYTQLCAKRDADKLKTGRRRPSNQFLSIEERLASCRQLAMTMLAKGSIELSAKEVAEAVVAAELETVHSPKGLTRHEAIERAVADIRVCSFLTFSDDDGLRFAHKSFFEFFVAQALVVMLSDRYAALSNFARHTITKEMVEFLGSYARDREQAARVIELAYHNQKGDDDRVRTLFNRIVFASGKLLSKVNLVGGSVHDADLRRCSIGRSYAKEVTFTRVSLNNLVADQWRLEDCSFIDSEISNSHFNGIDCGLRLLDSKIVSTSFNDAKTVRLHGARWSCDEVAVRSNRVDLSGEATFKNVRVVAESVQVDGLELAGGSSLDIDASTIGQREPRSWLHGDTVIHLKRAVLHGIYLEPADIAGLIAPVGNAKRCVTLERCRGVIFTRDVSGTVLTPGNRSSLRRKFPGIIFADTAAVSLGLSLYRANTSAISDSDQEAMALVDAIHECADLTKGQSSLIDEVLAVNRVSLR